MKIIEGGVTAAKGFEAAATAAGIKYQGRTDMAIIYSEKPCKVAGTFTTNVGSSGEVGQTDCREQTEITGSYCKLWNCKCVYRRGRYEIL